MNLPTILWQIILHQLQKLHGRQNETRQHYATLPGSVASYGKCTQTRTFEIHANLLAYLADSSLQIPENDFWNTIKCQGGQWRRKRYLVGGGAKL